MIRMVVSGTGAIAERAHIPALKTIEGLEIIALQSRTAEKAQRVAETLWPEAATQPAVYVDFDEMLHRERPDAVAVFTPNYLHCEFTLKALAAGAHVLCEKPMAMSVAEARQMVAAAAAANRVLMVTMQRRYGGIESAIKRALEAGAIGRPYFIRARLSHGGPHSWAPDAKWFTTPAQAGGGATLDLGVHIADLAIWYLGEVESVQGQVATLGKSIDLDDSGAMLLKFRAGGIGVIEASWSSTPPLSAIEIYGSEGRVMTGYPRNDIAILRSDGTPAPGFSREEILSSFDPRDLLAPFRDLAHNFAEAIAGQTRPSPDGRDGLRALEAVEACYLSSQSGTRIKLPLQ